MSKKNISVSIDNEDWLRIRRHAANESLAIAALLKDWLEPHLKQLRKNKKLDQADVPINDDYGYDYALPG